MGQLFTILQNDISLIRLLPPYFQSVKDIIALMETEEIELSVLAGYIMRVYANVFIQTADEETIAAHERILKIFAQDGETLEFRRTRVLNRYNNTAPVTLLSLKKRLDSLLGIGEWELFIDYPNYMADLIIRHINNAFFNEAVNMLINLLPAHLALYVVESEYGKSTVYAGATTGSIHYKITAEVKIYGMG
jgi:hypothetical protein